VVQDFALERRLATALVEHFWASYASFCAPFPEVIPTLTALRQRGLKCGIDRR